ncbi:hypothetical protein OS188_02865 [Xanthomarina sp. F1114]|uniref:hypothetical protein n=1 Tax=Xanthomarina sp. F1114 TaxID=2996019 RepID=UPI00225E2D32|nr:hypothetical protein [Xanthomarina sp. F1114]MCX7546888.1 hypothetical protein [Xanthomarina sp. F1114]
MSIFKKTVIITLLGLLSFVLYLSLFYNPCGYSLFSKKTPDKYNLLIANEGSHFKDSLVSLIIQHYNSKPVNIKVISLSSLSDAQPKNQDAILILHSWYTWKPPKEVEIFINNHYRCLNNILVFSTSYQGDLKIEELDAITGSSKMIDVKNYASKIIKKLSPLLNNY